jgi:DNA-binding response OmpR family regulator
MQKQTILVIDDCPGTLKSVSFMLQKKYKVHTLPDSKRLNEFLELSTPDLFLIDCNMPDISGFDLVPLIRKFAKHEKTPILFFTADESEEYAFEAAKLGVCDFIVKPVDNIVLINKIKHHTEKTIRA